jgi:RNA polymerase sigma factor (sigma-70 family)
MLVAVRHVCPFWLENQREDLVQIALVRLIRRERETGIAGEYNLTYLRKVAYSLLVDELRRRKLRGERPLEDESERPAAAPVAATPTPEQRSHAKELGKAIQRCLKSLIPPRRRAMTLSLVGHANREIAALLGWDPKRAENLVTRGRADMRNCLEASGFAP